MASVQLINPEARGELRLVPMNEGADHTEYSAATPNGAVFVESVVSGGTPGDAQVVRSQPNVIVDYAEVKPMDREAQRQLLEAVMETADQDNFRLMQKVADRLERVGMSFPGVEVRWRGLTVEADVPMGSSKVPTLASAALSILRGCVAPFMLSRSGDASLTHRRVLLNNVDGVLRPGRMCLMLGPPGSGKTTLMKTLAAQLHKTYSSLRFTGSVTYNGKTPGTDFVAERAATYVSQQDTHIAEMTVAETLSFASESLGPGLSKQLYDVMRARELEAGVEPDPDLERLWVATFTQSRKNVLVEMFAKLLINCACKWDTACW